MSKKIVILSSGGDAPGMNAAIRSVVRKAFNEGFEVYGCERGFQGLVEQEVSPLTEASVANILQRGGTVLKTARCEAFHDPQVRQACLDFLTNQGITGLVILGGNGSFQGARKLAVDSDLQVIGIPCTIDNDIVGTDYTIGFDTARNTAVKAIDNIRDTAMSHERNFLIEVMGRATGFLAVDVGLAVGAEVILLPEYPLSLEGLVGKLQNKRREKLTSIIVSAEAEKSGHSFQLAEEIERSSGIEYKVCVLGHIQRGGAPSVRDRLIGAIMGAKAVDVLLAGHSNKMVAMIGDVVCEVDFSDEAHAVRYFDRPDLLKLNDVLCDI